MSTQAPAAPPVRAPSSRDAAPPRAAALPAHGHLAWRALALILLFKALVFAAVWFGYERVDFNAAVYEDSVHFHQPAEYGFLTRLTTWDASHYLRLAGDGYSRDLDGSNAFAPALPLLVRAAGLLTGDLVVAGLLVANAASAAACYLLFDLVRRRWGEAAAWRALVLLLAFPTAFFLSLVYTESLFLLLAVAVVYALDRVPSDARWLAVAAAAAFLMPLTRPIGVAVALPLALWVVTSNKLQVTSRAMGRPNLLLVTCYLLLVAAPLAGAAAHLGYMQAATGDALAHVHAQALYGADWQAANLLRPWVFAGELLPAGGLSFHGHLDSAVDRLFFLGFLASAPLVWRRVGRVQGIGVPLFALYLALGLLPPLLGSFMAYTRFLLVAFPLFIAWGDLLGSRPRLLRYGVGVMALLQLAAVLAHTSSRWVA